MKNRCYAAIAFVSLVGAMSLHAADVGTPAAGEAPARRPKPPVLGWAKTRVEEKLDRGLVVMPAEGGKIYLGWRLLKTDPRDTAFDVYRAIEAGQPEKLNKAPVKLTTDFVDEQAPTDRNVTYWVELLSRSSLPQPSEKVTLSPAERQKRYHSFIRFRGEYTPGKIAIADLNGDGRYDFIIRQPNNNVDPGVGGPNLTGLTYKIEAYLSDGTFLWRKDLGYGIEPGIWYAPMVVCDLDGDGKAEVALKTAPMNLRRDKGRIRTGLEWCSVFDGMTGREITFVDWLPRDPRLGGYNTTNRNQLGVAYLDGKTPCLIVARGTYRLMMVKAYQLRDRKLEELWYWEGDEESPMVRGQGAHTMVSADVDSDGREEVLLGSCALDDNGVCMWSTGLGHPDSIYVTDIDPARPGMEVLYAIEPRRDADGVCMVDARTGSIIWGIDQKTYHVGGAMTADIDPAIPGLECWAREDSKGGSRARYMFEASGKRFGQESDIPGTKNWVFWDADLLREYAAAPATTPDQQPVMEVLKSGGKVVTAGIEGRIVAVADILGDWREEVITTLPGELRVYTTTIPAADRRVCLMQDAVYRSMITGLTTGYSQNPIPSYYLGAAAAPSPPGRPAP